MIMTHFLLIIIGVVIVIGGGLWLYSIANRLDRLYVRSDLAWQALDGALTRRAVVTRAIAFELDRDCSQNYQLGLLADRAERSSREHREEAENDLSAALSLIHLNQLPPELISELADAEARVLLARRFYNDAVRDTRMLAERPLIRLLHLGGRASIPHYFEIVERANITHDSTTATPDHSSQIIRLLILNEAGQVLLIQQKDCLIEPYLPYWWLLPGGSIDPKETPSQAALRYAQTQLGLDLNLGEIIGPLWHSTVTVTINHLRKRTRELYCVYRFFGDDHRDRMTTIIDQDKIQHRWCSSHTLIDLVQAGGLIQPCQLSELLAEANRYARQPPSEPITIRSIR